MGKDNYNLLKFHLRKALALEFNGCYKRTVSRQIELQ